MKEQEQTEVLTNQTQFFDQETMFEEPPVLGSVGPEKKNQEVAPKKKLPLLMLSLLGVSLILILLGTAAVLSQQRPTVSENKNPDTQKTSTVEKPEIQKRVNELDNDLKAADPITLELPFPIVSEDVFIDPPSR